jgi:hypothetical protein
MIFGDDFLMHYYQETWPKHRISAKNLKWTDVTDKLKIPRNNSTHRIYEERSHERLFVRTSCNRNANFDEEG